jgi:hypothetical protein
MIRQRSVCTFWQVLVMTALLAGVREGVVRLGGCRFGA